MTEPIYKHDMRDMRDLKVKMEELDITQKQNNERSVFLRHSHYRSQ